MGKSENKKLKINEEISNFLLWRETNCPELNFKKCWDKIRKMRDHYCQGLHAFDDKCPSWVFEFGYSSLYNEMVARGLTGKGKKSKVVEQESEIGQYMSEGNCTLHSWEEADAEVILANTILQKRVQKLQDTERIKNKGWRENNRLDNALGEANKELVKLLETVNLSEKTVFHKVESSTEKMGLIQLSDIHFNELINLKNNKYDFNIASQRLYLLAEKSISYFKMQGITHVVVASTGDLLNKDDILDKLLSNATNRMNACLLATSILSQFLLHLNAHFKKITFCGVTGNETRMSKDIAWSDQVVSDNYDLMLYNMLRARFMGSESVVFHVDDPLEQVIEVAGNNVLLMHGHQLGRDLANGVKKAVAKYSYEGIQIDYVLSGHLHEAYISDNYSRSSGMCGQNSYSDKGLQLSGRASQNIGIFYKNKNRDIIKVDLQHVEGVEGYTVTKELESYNAKSHDKLCKNKTIFKIVI